MESGSKYVERTCDHSEGWLKMFLLSMALVGLLLATDSESVQAAVQTAGVKAPDFHITTLKGDTYTKDSLKGQPTLLVFWAPWCKVCQRELPQLAQFSVKEKPSSLRVLGVGFADTRSNVEEFVKTRSNTFIFPTAYDEDNQMAQTYRAIATPTFVLLDSEGNIVMYHRGGGVLQNVQFREFLSTLKG